MGQTSVAQFASELGLPAELLLEQLRGAGVNKAAADDTLTEHDKTSLLEFLRKEHGAQAPKNKITLTRRQNTEIKKTDSSGKARTIQVEVRKKRVLVRRDPSLPEQDDQGNEFIPESQAELEVQEYEAIAETPVSDQVVEEAVHEEPVAEPEPIVAVEAEVETVIEEPEVISEPVIAAEVAPEPAAPASSGRISVLSPEQIAKREEEARRHAALVAIQTAELRKKQEILQKRQEEEAKKAAAAAAEAAKPAKVEGTLHKPAVKEAAKADVKAEPAKEHKKAAKKAHHSKAEKEAKPAEKTAGAAAATPAAPAVASATAPAAK